MTTPDDLLIYEAAVGLAAILAGAVCTALVMGIVAAVAWLNNRKEQRK